MKIDAHHHLWDLNAVRYPWLMAQGEVPYRLVHCDGERSAGDPGAGNLLVQGDNLEALKALLPYYAGKVKCIYIDPPYNTGNEGWVYNDIPNLTPFGSITSTLSRWMEQVNDVKGEK